MAEHVPHLPIAVDPLIAEARDRTRRRRSLLAGGLAVVLALSLLAYAAFGRLDRSSSTAGAPVNLRGFVGGWWHHGASLEISPSGWGLLKGRTYREKPPGEMWLTFRVLNVSGSRTAGVARIRVLTIHGGFLLDPAESPRPGNVSFLRLRHGVITATGNRTFGTFCAPNVGLCGL